jgi:hypothetical protein
VAGAARFNDRQGAVPLAILHDVRDVDPRISDGRNAGGRGFVGAESVHQGRVHDRDPFRLEKIQELLGRIGGGKVRELRRQR